MYCREKPDDQVGKMAKKSNKISAKSEQQTAARRMRGMQLAERQRYAQENNLYRRKIESINGRGGVDTYYYRLPNDEKKRGKDYFFVMRKFVCFLMFLLMLVAIAYFALSFMKFSILPANMQHYGALFVETEPKAAEEVDEEGEGEEEEASEADYTRIYGEGEEEEEEGEEEEEEEGGETAPAFDGDTYYALDPLFGAIKYWSNRLLNSEINLGESPMYDAMIAKYEAGMTDTIAPIVILVLPLAFVIYIITALVLMIKAFLGMFGKRIFKCFGLGAIIMLLCGVVIALGGLAFATSIDMAMDFGGIVNVLIGTFTGVGGVTGGYGLLALLGLPLVVLILSMFARKRIPYSIFDTYGE